MSDAVGHRGLLSWTTSIKRDAIPSAKGLRKDPLLGEASCLKLETLNRPSISMDLAPRRKAFAEFASGSQRKVEEISGI